MTDTENNPQIPINRELKEAMRGACNCLAIRKKARQITRLYDDKLNSYGLTISQFGIMTAIFAKKELSVQELADLLDLNQSALSRSLTPLERGGFIVSVADKNDGRKRVLILTQSGKNKINDASIAWKQAQDESAEII